jgi:hypothetical protein
VLHDEVGIPGFMVMMRYSYNIVQGEFIGASKRLITDVLRKEWGFKGPVISDSSTYSCKEPVIAGMDLEVVSIPGLTSTLLTHLIALSNQTSRQQASRSDI